MEMALSSFILIILLVGISHVGEMLSMLHNDMEDDAERRGFYEITYGDQVTFHEGEVISTNNQRRFAKAQHLASVTVIFLYTSTVVTAIYLMCCISLLHGAVNCKRQYMYPWIIAATLGVVVHIAVSTMGDGYPCVTKVFGGHHIYRFGSFCSVVTLIYAIAIVGSFALENAGVVGRCGRISIDERGERLLLLDHSANCSLLSAAQINKLSTGSRSQFV